MCCRHSPASTSRHPSRWRATPGETARWRSCGHLFSKPVPLCTWGGGQEGARPSAERVREFLASEPLISAWIDGKALDAKLWSYTQWEAWLSLYQCGRPSATVKLFICVGSTLSGTIDPAAQAHLAALRASGHYAEIEFAEVRDLALKLLTSDFGAQVHGSMKDVYRRCSPSNPLNEDKRDPLPVGRLRLSSLLQVPLMRQKQGTRSQAKPEPPAGDHLPQVALMWSDFQDAVRLPLRVRKRRDRCGASALVRRGPSGGRCGRL